MYKFTKSVCHLLKGEKKKEEEEEEEEKNCARILSEITKQLKLERTRRRLTATSCSSVCQY